MKKTLIGLVVFAMLVGPLSFAHAQATDQSVAGLTLNDALKQVIALLIQEVQQLEARLAVVETNQSSQISTTTSSSSVVSSTGTTDATGPSASTSPSVTQQLQGVASQIGQTAPVVDQSQNPGTPVVQAPILPAAIPTAPDCQLSFMPQSQSQTVYINGLTLPSSVGFGGIGMNTPSTIYIESLDYSRIPGTTFSKDQVVVQVNSSGSNPYCNVAYFKIPYCLDSQCNTVFGPAPYKVFISGGSISADSPQYLETIHF